MTGAVATIRSFNRYELKYVIHASQIERIVAGHLHRPIQSRVGGILASTAPSTAHQVALDLEERPLSFTMEPPACQLHVWSAETGLVSHMSYIGDYDGPYLFATGMKRER